MSSDEHWEVGQGGVLVRNLVPDTRGRDFRAHLMRVQKGEPVGEPVHFHGTTFHLVYCTKGWVQVVYEDQGHPFVLRPGDCVYQPPEIRHQIVECSLNMELLEVTNPAEHVTGSDESMTLPTKDASPLRRFGGQRFVHHVAQTATYTSSLSFRIRALGISGAHVMMFLKETRFTPEVDTFVFDTQTSGARLLDAGNTMPVNEGDELVVVDVSQWLRA